MTPFVAPSLPCAPLVPFPKEKEQLVTLEDDENVKSSAEAQDPRGQVRP